MPVIPLRGGNGDVESVKWTPLNKILSQKQTKTSIIGPTGVLFCPWFKWSPIDIELR